MKVRFEAISEADREAAIDIFNYYIKNSYAAFLDRMRSIQRSLPGKRPFV